MVPLLPLPPLRVTADVTNTTLTNAHATTHTAANGGGRATSLASLQRFWAIAASVNSSCAPQGPRSLSRLSLKMRFKCAKQHLDTLAVASGLLERIGTGARASDITSVFVDIARDHACRSIRAAFGFEGTRAAIAGASDISKFVLGENAPGCARIRN